MEEPFRILVVVMGSRVYLHVKTYQIVPFKHLWLVLCDYVLGTYGVGQKEFTVVSTRNTS